MGLRPRCAVWGCALCWPVRAGLSVGSTRLLGLRFHALALVIHCYLYFHKTAMPISRGRRSIVNWSADSTRLRSLAHKNSPRVLFGFCGLDLERSYHVS